MDRVGNMANDLKEVMRPLVAMIVAEINPSKDMLSTREAWRMYGKGWITSHIRRGNLTVLPMSNRNMLSRVEIEALLTAEKELSRTI